MNNEEREEEGGKRKKRRWGIKKKRQLDEELCPTLFDTVSLIIPISNQKKREKEGGRWRREA